jgi:hypothetical protein
MVQWLLQRCIREVPLGKCAAVMLAVPLAVLLTLVISAAPAAAEPRWKERCHFPGQPRMTVTFRPLQPSIGHTIQFGSESPLSLDDHASVGTGLRGHVYAANRNGRLFVFVLGAEPGRRAARLTIWPSQQVYDEWAPPKPRPKPVHGKCRRVL